MRKLIDFIYPRFCLHCSSKIEDNKKIFCKACSSLLCCNSAQEKYLSTHCTSYLWDYDGPPKTLVKEIKYGFKPYLAKIAASFMAKQFVDLNWPKPDIIVPVPQTLPSKIVRGYNQSTLIAKSLGKILSCPYKSIFKRKIDSYPQTGKEKAQREETNFNDIKIKKCYLNKYETILIIDDVISTGTTMSACVNAIAGKSPSKIYALALCQS